MGCGYEGLGEEMGDYGVHRRVMEHMGIYGAQESVGKYGPQGAYETHRGSLGYGDLWGTHGVMKHRGPKKH